MRFALDPKAAEDGGGALRLEGAPKKTRDFGKCPRLSQLQAGDLILVSPTRPSGMARLIRRVQGESHEPFDAEWVHAAAYLGENALVEIDGRGVRLRELSKYVPGYRFLFRRPIDLAGAPVDPLTGYKIAVAALMAFQTNYNLLDLLRITWDGTVGKSGIHKSSDLHTTASICSTFYSRAVFVVLERPASGVKHRIIHPADLCRSDRLVDVQVGWAPLG